MTDETQIIDWVTVPRPLTEAMRDAFWRNMTRDIEDGIVSAADRCWADMLDAASPMTEMPTTEQRLREALRNLLDADRDFLGADNVCVYCGRHQRDEGHSSDCVITKAMEALL